MRNNDECLLEGDDRIICSGGLNHYHSTIGSPMTRCDAHYADHLKVQERIDRDYPDSPMAPSWFDPADAGEHWDYDY